MRELTSGRDALQCLHRGGALRLPLELYGLAVGETVILMTLQSPSLLIHLLKVEGDAAE